MENELLANAFVDELEKIAGIVPKGSFIDPRSDDFSKNQALGRGIGAGLLPGALGSGLTVGGLVGQSPRMRNVGLASLLLAAGVGTGVYGTKLKKFRKLQAEGRNPVTGRKHDPVEIERTRKWAQKMRNTKSKASK